MVFSLLFLANTVLVVLSSSFNDTKEFTNDSVRLENSNVVVDKFVYSLSNRIVSDVIAIQATNELIGNLTINFIIRKDLKIDIPVSI